MQLAIIILLAVVLLVSIWYNVRTAKLLAKTKEYNERLFTQLLTYQHVNKLVEARLTAGNLNKTQYRLILAAILKDEDEALKPMPDVYEAYRKIKGLPATE